MLEVKLKWNWIGHYSFFSLQVKCDDELWRDKTDLTEAHTSALHQPKEVTHLINIANQGYWLTPKLLTTLIYSF